MLECLGFIFKLILQFLYMLFDIDVGFTSLGTLMCVTFIFLPMVLTVINFIKVSLIDELDQRVEYDRISLIKNKNKNNKNKNKSKHKKEK